MMCRVIAHGLLCMVGEPARELLCRPRTRKCLVLSHLFFYRFQVDWKPSLPCNLGRELYWESVGREEREGVNVVSHLFEFAHTVRKCRNKPVFFKDNLFTNSRYFLKKFWVPFLVFTRKELAQCGYRNT